MSPNATAAVSPTFFCVNVYNETTYLILVYTYLLCIYYHGVDLRALLTLTLRESRSCPSLFLSCREQPELHRDRIYGAHIAEYMEYLTEEDETKYKEHFAAYIENEITFDDVEEMYKVSTECLIFRPVYRIMRRLTSYTARCWLRKTSWSRQTGTTRTEFGFWLARIRWPF